MLRLKNKINSCLFILATLLSACSTDLSVIGDYKETMVIYGLLDQGQTKQYIKINKAFLGEGNAMQYAQIKDSSQYANALNVTIKRIRNGNVMNTYTLNPDNTIPKNPGTFYGPDQENAIYSFDTPLGTLDVDSEYELTVKNNQSGTTASGSTILINDATITSPSPNAPSFTFVSAGNDNFEYPIRWQTGVNAREYQLTLRLNYIDSTTSGNVTQKLDWIFPQQKTEKLTGGESMKNDILGVGFLKFVGNQLGTYSGLIARRAINAQLLLVAASDDLETFIEVNKPSTSIVQERPEYTNITNGLGIFASRYNTAPITKPLGTTTWDSLACGRYTVQLKFLNHSGLICQ